MAIYEAGEMYLMTIYLLYQKGMNKVRAIDVCREIKRSKPSVSIALSQLKDEGYISVTNGKIELKEEGNRIAKKILSRREAVSRMLEKMGVDKEISMKDACKIEHVISDEACDAIYKFIGDDSADK
ncbi:MAG: metal-dependent transcriptional regulator [Lachnospiraceae bacterium]|nr:metal-dependent transcriptional regulator [Lachnospiraceae bacterium]